MFMLKRVCDKCGVSIGDEDVYYDLEVTKKNVWISQNTYAELCKECCEKLEKWLNEKPKSFPELDQ